MNVLLSSSAETMLSVPCALEPIDRHERDG